MPQFKEMPCHRDQVVLVPTCLDDEIAADCDVRVLDEIMDMLDWSGIEGSYSAHGCPAYPPRVMGKLLAYAYSNGVRSSRKIEALVENDKRYMWLAGGLRPDFHTLARFRREKWDHLVKLFEDSARVAAECGLVFLNDVSIDGSKIRGNASRRSVYDQKRVERESAHIEKVMREAEEADRLEDAELGSSNGRKLPENLKSIEARKARLKKAAALLEESKRDRVVATDPQSRVMKTKDGNRPCFNLQAAVDAENQIVVAMKVVDNETDHGQLPGMMQKIEETMGMSADVHEADTGFCDEQTMQFVESSGKNVLMPPQEATKEKREALFCNQSFLHDETEDVLLCPAGRELSLQRLSKHVSGTYKVYAARGCQSCSFYKQCAGGKTSRLVSRSVVHREREQMRERLRSEEGKQRYKLRGQTVEPVFGQMKTNRGLDRLLLRGLEGAKAELALALLAHNVMKCGQKLTHEAAKALACSLEARIFADQMQLFVVSALVAITAVYSLLSKKHRTQMLGTCF
jgi:transposase